MNRCVACLQSEAVLHTAITPRCTATWIIRPRRPVQRSDLSKAPVTGETIRSEGTGTISTVPLPATTDNTTENESFHTALPIGHEQVNQQQHDTQVAPHLQGQRLR